MSASIEEGVSSVKSGVRALGSGRHLYVLEDRRVRTRQKALTGGALGERGPVLEDARDVRLEREAARRRRHAERELDARRQQLEQHYWQARTQRRLEQHIGVAVAGGDLRRT